MAECISDIQTRHPYYHEFYRIPVAGQIMSYVPREIPMFAVSAVHELFVIDLGDITNNAKKTHQCYELTIVEMYINYLGDTTV